MVFVKFQSHSVLTFWSHTVYVFLVSFTHCIELLLGLVHTWVSIKLCLVFLDVLYIVYCVWCVLYRIVIFYLFVCNCLLYCTLLYWCYIVFYHNHLIYPLWLVVTNCAQKKDARRRPQNVIHLFC